MRESEKEPNQKNEIGVKDFYLGQENKSVRE